jgi:serine/threonine protein kinase
MSYTQGSQESGLSRPEFDTGRTLRNGDYRIDAMLGHGGMGRVFLAMHTALHMPVAIKQGPADRALPSAVAAELDRLLHAAGSRGGGAAAESSVLDIPLSGGEHTDRFLREALLLAHLQHASLPAIYDYFIEEGNSYLVMDYIPGPTLAAYIQQHAPLEALEALNYAIQLCDVLEYLHDQAPPVIFRDLKPSNIILAPDGRVMLVDFGIARRFKSGQLSDTTDFGSPGYASPEQYKGEGQTDGRSDLYSLGVILHEMLSGRHPLEAGAQLGSLRALNPGISSVLSGLVHVATRADPTYRFQAAHTLYLALERAYSVEERRTYQRSVQDTPDQWAPLHVQEGQDAWQTWQWQAAQRQQVRAALLEGRRSAMSFPPMPSLVRLPAGPQARHSQRVLRSGRGRERLPQAILALALLVFVVIAALYVSAFYLRPPRRLPQQSHSSRTTTPSARATSRLSSSDTGSWQALPALPSPEADNTAVYLRIQGRAYIYMTGGFRGPRAEPRYDPNFYRYDIELARWEVLAQAGIPGMVNNALALDERQRLFFTAGYSSNDYAITSLLFMYDPRSGKLQTISPPAPIALGYGAALLADQRGHLYMTQGFLQAGNPAALAGSGWYRYDIATGQWHALKPLPLSAGYVILAADGAGHIDMLGGARDAGQNAPVQRIYRYDIVRDSWSAPQPEAPGSLSGASSCLSGQGQLVIVGGYDAAHSRSVGRVWLLDVPDLRWTSLAALPEGGSVLGSAACDGAGHVYLARGASDPSSPTRDFWRLTLPAAG